MTRAQETMVNSEYEDIRARELCIRVGGTGYCTSRCIGTNSKRSFDMLSKTHRSMVCSSRLLLALVRLSLSTRAIASGNARNNCSCEAFLFSSNSDLDRNAAFR